MTFLRPKRSILPFAALVLALAIVVPAALAHGNDGPIPEQADSIVLEPDTGTNFLGEPSTFTAVIHDEECCGVAVTFTVLDGPNAGKTAVVTSDDTGHAPFTYTSAATGTDHIQASFDDPDEGRIDGSNTVSQVWQQSSVALTVPGRPPALVKSPGDTSFSGAQPVQDLPRGTVVDIGGDRAVIVQNYLGDKMTFLGVPDRVPSRFTVVAGVRSRIGTIVLNLTGGNFKQCSGDARRLAVHSAASKPKKPVRRLWGSGKGHYTTKGKYASATVRGTFWEIADFCDGTLIHVREGSVQIHDFVTGKNVVIKTGQTYFAHAPG